MIDRVRSPLPDLRSRIGHATADRVHDTLRDHWHTLQSMPRELACDFVLGEVTADDDTRRAIRDWLELNHPSGLT